MIHSINKIKRLLSKSGYGEQLVKGHSVSTAWLLPNGYSITADMYDHSDILDSLKISPIEAYKAGWIRKALDCEYEFDRNKRKSIQIVEDNLRSIINDYCATDIIFIDAWDGMMYYYQFTVKDFRQSGMDLRSLLTEKYELYNLSTKRNRKLNEGLET